MPSRLQRARGRLFPQGSEGVFIQARGTGSLEEQGGQLRDDRCEELALSASDAARLMK